MRELESATVVRDGYLLTLHYLKINVAIVLVNLNAKAFVMKNFFGCMLLW